MYDDTKHRKERSGQAQLRSESVQYLDLRSMLHENICVYEENIEEIKTEISPLAGVHLELLISADYSTNTPSLNIFGLLLDVS